MSKLAEEFLELTVEAKDTEPAKKSTTKKSATKKNQAAESKEKPAKIITKDNPKFLEMGQNLRWLISEGYVVEYSDGKLFAPPPRSPSRERIKNEPPSVAVAGISDKIDKPSKKSEGKALPVDPVPESSETEEIVSSISEADPENAEKIVPIEEPPTEVEPPPETPVEEANSGSTEAPEAIEEDRPVIESEGESLASSPPSKTETETKAEAGSSEPEPNKELNESNVEAEPAEDLPELSSADSELLEKKESDPESTQTNTN